MSATMERWATISPDKLYRYTLTRDWSLGTATPDRTAVWVMLNPSVADGRVDDPTIRRVCGFTALLGYLRAVVVNLYAYRATDPADLTAALGSGVDIVGPLNDSALAAEFQGAATIIAAWGAHQEARARVGAVTALATEHGRSMMCLGTTKNGHPRHPLYLPSTAQLAPWPT